ncbi:MAG: OmpP1/FadL family transporter [Hansschlegelia sp.]
MRDRISLRPARLALVAALLASVAATPAFAGAFAIREQSATGQGVGFAGMAAGGGDSISGMFWNPAVVNQVENYQGEQHITAILPSSKIDVDASTPTAGFGGGGDVGETAFVSAGYNAYRINEKVAIGLSINTPFGLATDPHHDWAGQIYARSSRVRSVNATPTIGYKVNDWLSIGAGVQIQYFDLRLRQAYGAGPAATLPTAESATLSGHDVGVGFTAGFTVAPTDGTSIGVGFRSAIKHDVSGKLALPDAPDAKIKADLTLPETVSVGVRQRISDRFTLLGGFEWTNWSRFDRVKVKSKAAGSTITTLPFNYDDAWFFSAGGEYALDPKITLRGGVAYELSPISDKVRSNRLPDDDRWWLSAGATYNWSDKLAFDLGYSYIFVPGKSKIDIEPGDPDYLGLPYHAKAKSDIHLISAAVRYKFGGETPAVLVTKN